MPAKQASKESAEGQKARKAPNYLGRWEGLLEVINFKLKHKVKGGVSLGKRR